MKTDEQTDLAEVIGDVYDAAFSTESWPTLLQRFSDALGKIDVALVVRDLKAEEVTEPVEGEAEAAEVASRYRLSIKVGTQRARGKALGLNAGNGGGDPEAEVFPAESVVLGCFVSRDRPTGVLVAIQRSEKQSLSRDWDSGVLRHLAPHLRRGFDLYNQFLTTNIQRAATKNVLDHFPVGVMLVDPRGRVLTKNTCADGILALSDGLAVDRSGVYAESSQETTALRELIAEAATSTNGDATRRGGAMTLTRPSLLRPFWVLVVPLPGRRAEGSSAGSIVAMFVSDPDRRHEIPAEALERFFGLTPAETRLLDALVNGKSLEEASEDFHVTKNTLRTQLHQIFRKTSTSRQSEVIKLVLSTPVHMETVH